MIYLTFVCQWINMAAALTQQPWLALALAMPLGWSVVLGVRAGAALRAIHRLLAAFGQMYLVLVFSMDLVHSAAAGLAILLVYPTFYCVVCEPAARECARRQLERARFGPRCVECGYILRGLSRPRCPECGRWFAPTPTIVEAGAPNRTWQATVVASPTIH